MLETNRKTAEVTLPSDREILIKREFQASRSQVFAAWTTPAQVAQWWDPNGQPLASCDIDLRPGGTFRFVHAGNGYAFTGTYTEVVPPSRLIFETPSPSGGVTIGTLTLEQRDSTTFATVAMRCQSKDDRDALLRMGVDKGTVQTLANLETFLIHSRRQ